MKKILPYFSYTFLAFLLVMIIVTNLLAVWDRREANKIGLTAKATVTQPYWNSKR